MNKNFHRRFFYLFLFLAILIGGGLGLSSLTFYYGDGYAYLIDNPRACMNCHIMRPQYESWNKSPHHHVATCNDCHTPINLLGKYTSKAFNGLNHSIKFTLGNFHEPIQINAINKAIVTNACVSCHLSQIPLHNKYREENNCLHCHKNVGH